ncbi:MAG: hypothetical protein FWF06_02960 [Symbiobacteriaceae bacterium]|nr:hypothetical protein [Symbiobacteriaceae bacterium]
MEVNLEQHTVSVTHDLAKATVEQLATAVVAAGYEVELV